MKGLALWAAGLGLMLMACAHAPAGGPSVAQVTLVERDTEWRGDVRVDGIVHIRKNATLTIAPGTRILFAARTFAAGEEHEGFVAPGFKIEGRVIASGTEDAPIFFSTAGGKVHPAAWDKLLFTFSTGSRFDWCTFEGARYAFHTHFSELSVSHCTFRENEEGLRMGNSKIRIEDSVFTRNEIRGINFRDCRNEIRRNLVYENGDGIFLHSKDAASVIRENAIYANRHFNLRLGDLHVEDFDAGGNWWGTRSETAAREKIYDGVKLAGIGNARLAPMLALPPVTGAVIRGVIVSGQSPVEGAELRALSTVADGFFAEDRVAEALSDADGLFILRVPPGRWFLAGRKGTGAGSLFSFPGRNPVPVEFGGREDVAMPSVALNDSALPDIAQSSRQGVTIRVTSGGIPVPGATVQAFRPDAPDFRGPGESSALTGKSGAATLSLRPGKYLLAARKRPGGASIGVVDEGGLFGVWPGSPVEVRPSSIAKVEIPVVEKRGLIGGASDAAQSASDATEKTLDGSATLAGIPAGGHIVYFYRPGETIGRPLARSTVLSAEGGFSVSLAPGEEYVAFLRKAIPGVPGGVGEERFGPAPVSTRTGRLEPRALRFEAAPR